MTAFNVSLPVLQFVITYAFTGDTTYVDFTILVTAQATLEWTMRAYPYLAVVPADAPNDACIYTLSASVDGEETEVNYFLRTSQYLH